VICEYCEKRQARPKLRTCSARCGKELRDESARFAWRLPFNEWAGWTDERNEDAPVMRNSCDVLRDHAALFGGEDEYEVDRAKRGVLIAFDSIKKARITHAIDQAGIPRSTHYGMIRRDPEYKAKVLMMKAAA
jgi:hypothetical protein